ncbi:DUF454 family protein [Mechercharimyces sp. CAU 1602]|uniref:DUF454 family protein n=1 Tax=Mechercharimyces sp. CAU 1602 TaxID=2973933 RepID=UPI0021614E15|nr:DUF454 family protein [Mechercharimyces sp. CAU 1602]MCS1350521.1 DUF454 family protein [Mechercharimyces sp. CAU 1602]
MAQISNFLMICLGWSFVGLGFLGLFLPILQGVLFLVIGFAILSKRSPAANRFLRYLERRFPTMAKKYEQIKQHKWYKRFVKTTPIKET